MSYNQNEEYTSKAALIYDGDCGFCRYWVERWQSRVGDQVEFIPCHDIGTRFPELTQEQCAESVYYVDPYGAAFHGAEAVFRLMTHARGRGWILPLYQGIPGFKPLSESAYRFIAARQRAAGRISKVLWGARFQPPDHYIGRWLFLRNLGLIFFVAFYSFYIQLPGLIGSSGIISAAYTVEFLEQTIEEQRYLRFPSIFWFDVSDEALAAGCVLGMIASAFVVAGVAVPIMLFFAWGLYLSLLNVGQDFLSFQWDILLLEAGFLAIFFSPPQLRPRFSREPRPSPLLLFLFWWLIFRLMFSSGVVKLNDSTWTSLMALTHHYETQPLPTRVAWYAHQLPVWFHQGCVAALFFVEIVVPFLIFLPRRPRHIAGVLLVVLHLTIAATGNHAFFNWLTIALCFLLFDDQFWRTLIPKSLWRVFTTPPPYKPIPWVRRVLSAVLLVSLLPLSLVPTIYQLKSDATVPRTMAMVHDRVSGFHFVGSYGLFANLSADRPEIEFQGSHDGQTWRTYHFKWKPGDVDKPPRWAAPHQPRLDWHLWLAARSSYETTPWVTYFVIRLLEGAPDVLDLLEENPFPERPPRYLRAIRFDYRFTDAETRRETGAWWEREETGMYFQPLSLTRGIF